MRGDGGSWRIDYLVSRFPTASETFVVREMNAVAEAQPAIGLRIRSLFSPEDPFLHPSAERWGGELRQPTGAEALRALAWWTRREPRALARAIGTVVRAFGFDRRALARNLTALALGAAHARDLRAAPVDHVHAHFAAYPALAAWVIHRLAGVTYSFTAHAYDIFVDQRLLDAKIEGAEFVVAISDFTRRFLEAHRGGVTPIHLVHCGVDPEAYEYRPREGGRNRGLRLLCVASLQEKKGQGVLLEALAGAEGDLARAELDLVGGGEMRAELEELAERFGLGSRVRFHGALAEPEVRRMLGEADAFVLPSIIAADGQMEGIPVALMEAMASGLPVVASRMSGIPELIEDGREGFLAEPGDPDDLGRALRRLVDGPPPDLDAARRRVEAEFDVRESGRRMAALFDGLPQS